MSRFAFIYYDVEPADKVFAGLTFVSTESVKINEELLRRWFPHGVLNYDIQYSNVFPIAAVNPRVDLFADIATLRTILEHMVVRRYSENG